ncbi:peptide deformylase [Bacillus fonticola]|uniref:peptide deformylase n=1 Tax=Bacillus fonticola TaxID=2728853 RepID=UPI002AD2140F|nr:peptide deformylase [Bacillus fonticola]
MDDFVRENDPALRKVAREISVPFAKEHRELLQEMRTFLLNSQDTTLCKRYELRRGVGLAAPQLGKSVQLLTIYTSDEEGNQVDLQLANPKIVKQSEELIYLASGEGCLSVNRPVYGLVPRSATIEVEASIQSGKAFRGTFEGFTSIVLQHEIDHLQGILFYDRINKENPFHLLGNPCAKPVRDLQ